MSVSLECQEGSSKNEFRGCYLTRQNKLFINRSLCPYYKVLWLNSKNLHSLGKIFNFNFSSDISKIKFSENSPQLSITHVDDFGKYFPEVDLSPPEHSE